MFMLWYIKDIADICDKARIQKFDCIVCFTGARGIGKSTGALKVGMRLGMKLKKDLVYSREELLRSVCKWNKVIVADEMINAAYKREFHNTDQIELVKRLNMNRDHQNVLIMSIPNFWDLDKPLRDLVKLRIDIIKRGIGVVHTQLRNAYMNDPWDMKNNQKIEQGWQKSSRAKPRYNKLSTFKGILKFSALSPSLEKRYQEVKDLKRAMLSEDYVEQDEDKRLKDEHFYENILDMINQGIIDKEKLIKIAESKGRTYDGLNKSIHRFMKKKKMKGGLSTLFYEQKKRPEYKEQELEQKYGKRIEIPEI